MSDDFVYDLLLRHTQAKVLLQKGLNMTICRELLEWLLMMSSKEAYHLSEGRTRSGLQKLVNRLLFKSFKLSYDNVPVLKEFFEEALADNRMATNCFLAVYETFNEQESMEYIRYCFRVSIETKCDIWGLLSESPSSKFYSSQGTAKFRRILRHMIGSYRFGDFWNTLKYGYLKELSKDGVDCCKEEFRVYARRDMSTRILYHLLTATDSSYSKEAVKYLVDTLFTADPSIRPTCSELYQEFAHQQKGENGADVKMRDMRLFFLYKEICRD